MQRAWKTSIQPTKKRHYVHGPLLTEHPIFKLDLSLELRNILNG